MIDVYKGVILILLVIGAMCITFALTQIYRKCPDSKIVYRFIPRTFKEEQESPIPVTEIFKSLFNDASPFVAGFEPNRIMRLEQQRGFLATLQY